MTTGGDQSSRVFTLGAQGRNVGRSTPTILSSRVGLGLLKKATRENKEDEEESVNNKEGEEGEDEIEDINNTLPTGGRENRRNEELRERKRTFGLVDKTKLLRSNKTHQFLRAVCSAADVDINLILSDSSETRTLLEGSMAIEFVDLTKESAKALQKREEEQEKNKKKRRMIPVEKTVTTRVANGRIESQTTVQKQKLVVEDEDYYEENDDYAEVIDNEPTSGWEDRKNIHSSNNIASNIHTLPIRDMRSLFPKGAGSNKSSFGDEGEMVKIDINLIDANYLGTIESVAEDLLSSLGVPFGKMDLHQLIASDILRTRFGTMCGCEMIIREIGTGRRHVSNAEAMISQKKEKFGSCLISIKKGVKYNRATNRFSEVR